MYTLYIDTHSNKIVLLIFENKKILIRKEVKVSFNHSSATMPILIDAIKEANIKKEMLNQILVVNGPGSFTGVRIGVTVAKTLAFTLNIPIKVLSSLLIKAVSFEHNDITIVEREKNGVFLASFDQNNNLKNDYIYLHNSECNEMKANAYYEDVSIDYEKIIQYSEKLESINPHAVNPLYVKKIEVYK